MRKAERGFTLIEVLVAVIIVALTVTVFFQLLSSSMRLDMRSRERSQSMLKASRIFDEVLQKNPTDEDFPWQDDTEPSRWDVKLVPVEVQNHETKLDEVNLVLPREVYKLVFTYRYGDSLNKSISLVQYKSYPLNAFTEDFLKEHLSEEENATLPEAS